MGDDVSYNGYQVGYKIYSFFWPDRISGGISPSWVS